MALSSNERDKKQFYTKRGCFGQLISTSDTEKIGDDFAQLFIGNGGDIKVALSGGSVVVLKNIPSGTFLKGVFVDKVYRTGTTARDIVAIY